MQNHSEQTDTSQRLISEQDKLLAIQFKEKGNEALQQNNLEKALKLFTQGIEYDNTNAVLYSNRSLVQLKLGNIENAIADAKNAIKYNPNWSKVVQS